MTIGDRIKQLRKARKMSQTELAEFVGTTKQNIYKYENNINTNIPSDKIEMIAHILGSSPAYIMGWNEGQEKTAPAENSTSGLTNILKVFSSDELDELSALSRDQATQVIELVRKLHKEK